MFKLLALTSSYFPNLIELERNISTYLPWVDKLLVWENTPQRDSSISELSNKFSYDRIEVKTTGQNEFLATPFNFAVNYAKENGYTHILLMDQDSYFEEDHFEAYINEIKNCVDSSIGVFSPNRDIVDQLGTFKEIPHAISSGSIIPIRVFETVGFFREGFLIDALDIEFCYRVRKMAYKVVCNTSIYLFHSLGYKQKNVGITTQNYSAQRTYYIVRNHIITFSLFGAQAPKGAKFDFYKYKIVYRLIKIFLEKNSLQKIKAIVIGILHGLFKREGQYLI